MLINYLIKKSNLFLIRKYVSQQYTTISIILNIKDFISLVKLASLVYSHKYTKELDQGLNSKKSFVSYLEKDFGDHLVGQGKNSETLN